MTLLNNMYSCSYFLCTVVIVALQQHLQSKYSHSGSDDIKITLKLPGLNKVERYFSLSDSTKVAI